eukprot:c18562_g1_i1.p1 GENE.c18562_g1_i1~~c18562_g1_i1.p1  ORF type:complete len:352 (-),score=109.98 c18562_g1_i1:88-1143(-)
MKVYFFLFVFLISENIVINCLPSSNQKQEKTISPPSSIQNNFPLQLNNSTFPNNNSTLIINGKILLVAICSAPNHFEQRQAIRESWGKINISFTSSPYTLLFFIGNINKANKTEENDLENKIIAESQSKKDIVRLDSFIESYRNLTRKTLAMIQWTVKNNFQVMLKVDDDSFVLLDRFYNDIIEYEKERNIIYWGKFWGGDDRPVSRAVDSKFYVSKEEYGNDFFPDYADGPCYALGSDILKHIDSHSEKLKIYSLEDAAIGIWLKQFPIYTIQLHGNGYMYQRYCQYGNDYYFINPVTPKEMSTIMTRYSKKSDICEDNFSLEVCSSEKGCLCSPSPTSCWDLQRIQDDK